MFLVRRILSAITLTLGLLAGSAGAWAGIDYSLANAGSQVPFSQLSDAIPTAWTLFNPRAVSGPTIGRSPMDWLRAPADLAEPGLGSPGGTTLGQIVPVGDPGADRSVWGVYDRLAAVPVPVLLYFDNFSRAADSSGAMPTRAFNLPLFTGGGAAGGGSSGGSSSGSTASLFPIEPPIEVPEPATALLLMPVALVLVMALRRQRA